MVIFFFQSYEQALRTVVSFNPDVMLPPLLEIVNEVLGDSELLNVTQNDYNIFLSPPGELFDKSVLSKYVGNDSYRPKISKTTWV